MGVIKKIQYDCRRATYLIEKRQLTKLTFKERLVLAIHLAGCGVCRLFQRQSKVINQLMRSLYRPANDQLRHLDEKTKRDMQERINDTMGK